MSARSAGRQRGMTLLVALIMLVLMTLFALSSFNLGKSSLQAVGNAQSRNQAAAAAQGTLEEAISATWFSTTPANALVAPCGGTANTRCFDVNGDGVNDVTVRLSPVPACLASRIVKNATLNLATSIDAGCATGVSQTFGVMGTASGDSLCADTMWELTATAADNITQASATVVQGVTLRVSKDNLATNCP
jgi:Tfp pilus assembly protein PilX